MKYVVILVLILCATQQGYSQEQASANALFSGVTIKKKKDGKICDTCIADYALHAVPEFSYVLTGARHNYIPHRFNSLKLNFKPLHKLIALSSTIHFISQRNIGISFLPNFLQEEGRRIQLYRNFGGEDYKNLEFKAEQNGRIIRQWTPLSALGEDKGYAILGDLSGQTISMPWKLTFFAGNFNLNVKDSLNITVRNIRTKQIIQEILVIRPVDKATNFVYYQIPLASSQFRLNLQNILNISSGLKTVYYGDSTNVFWKDYASIGILRFIGLDKSNVVEYSFEKNPHSWQSASSINAENGVFLVLGNDMEAGTYQDIYLRYKSQPETVHKITILVKEKPFEVQWGKIAVSSILLLTAGGIGTYLWNKKNKRKLALLKRKKEDAEARLALLSGQLNPHFLFNSLNAIQGTINSRNPDRANAYIGNVAGFMRDVMDNGKKEFVSLQEELKIEEDYLKLEQERLAFSYTIIISPELEPSLIDFPPLLLQPVLENSIRHAFSTELAHREITINISRDKTALCVDVADNGNATWNTDAVQEGHGLSLTRKRIAVYNEKLESMSIRMQTNYQPGSGTVTTFTFQNWLA